MNSYESGQSALNRINPNEFGQSDETEFFGIIRIDSHWRLTSD